MGVVTANNGHRIEATGELYDDQNRLVGRGVGSFARSHMKLEDVTAYGRELSSTD